MYEITIIKMIIMKQCDLITYILIVHTEKNQFDLLKVKSQPVPA